MNGGNNPATPSQSRPTKRARTTKTAARAAQPNNQRQTPAQVQVQQIQPATADPVIGHARTHPANQAQGPIIPNEGAFEPTAHQTNNFNPGSVQQTHQASPGPNFGLNNQANVDPNHGGFVQNSQPGDVLNNNFNPNPVNGANNLSLDGAATQNHGFEFPQSQSDSSNAWMDFTGSDLMNSWDFDFSLGSVPQGDSAKDRQTVPPQQDFPQLDISQPDISQLNLPQQAIQQQPAQQSQPVQQNQPAQERQVQLQSTAGENAEQVSNHDDLFGDMDYEQFGADLAPLARFNAEN